MKISAQRFVILAMLLVVAAGTNLASATDAAMDVSELIDALGATTQPGKADDWTVQRRSESDTASQIRARIAANPGATEFTERRSGGQRPLVAAALRGYADVVDALLSDSSVRAAINKRELDGLTAWQAAQFARPLTLVVCHPQVQIREAYGLWGSNLQRTAYFSGQSPNPFDRIRAAMAAAGAKPDLEGAKRYWLQQCPGHDPAMNEAIAASEDLLSTLVAESNVRWKLFFDTMKNSAKPLPVRALPPQPQFRSRPSEPEAKAKPASAPTPPGNVMICREMPIPKLDEVPWTGRVRLSMTVEVQDGTPVAAAVTDLSSGVMPPEVSMYFRSMIYKALANYRCPGDHLFQQEFQVTVE